MSVHLPRSRAGPPVGHTPAVTIATRCDQRYARTDQPTSRPPSSPVPWPVSPAPHGLKGIADPRSSHWSAPSTQHPRGSASARQIPGRSGPQRHRDILPYSRRAIQRPSRRRSPPRGLGRHCPCSSRTIARPSDRLGALARNSHSASLLSPPYRAAPQRPPPPPRPSHPTSSGMAT